LSAQDRPESFKRSLLAVLSAIVAVAAVTLPGAAVGGGELDSLTSDGQAPPIELRGEVAASLAQPLDGGSDPEGFVDVELVAPTLSGPSTTEAVRMLGGRVIGESPGVVLVRLPVSAVGQVKELLPSVQVREPLRVDLIPSVDGSAAPNAVSDVAAVTNAAAWHAAGHTGAGVRVGIVDYFDGASWSTAQAGGKVPSPSGTFCRVYGGSCDLWSAGEPHGVAVAEQIHAMAPDANIYLATVATLTDLSAAVDWFDAQGVHIISRSLSSALDGPGDGGGSLNALVDTAVARGMLWVNSAGNKASASGTADGQYWRGTWVDTNNNGWLEFAPGDEFLGFYCGFIQGFRWSDWSGGATDYDVAVFDYYTGALIATSTNDQTTGAPPLELVDPDINCSLNPVLNIAVQLYAPGTGTAGDVLEFMANASAFEYSQNAYSVTQPVSDSANSGVISVGAIDPGDGIVIAPYSSQGPTNDGRVQPSIAAPSCLPSIAYSPGCFNGTSAAAPVVSGASALVLAAGIATSPADLHAYLRSNAIDLGLPGPDFVYGSGQLRLPSPPGTVIQPTLSVSSPPAVVEGGVIGFTVTLSNLSVLPVSVDYASANGTAVAPGDYTAVAGELTFNPGGSLTQTVNVQTINDSLFEATETFTLGLSGATNATISNATGTGTILDNGGAPGISALDATANEGDGVIEFTVVLLPAAGQPVTVDWATADGTATSPADFIADSGSITFAPGETSKIIPVTIIDDDDDGVDKTFSLVLSNPIPPNTSVVDATAVGTIVDDDNVAPTIGVMKTVDGAGADNFVFAPGQTVRLTGNFTDPGLADAHTATINWGDGSPVTVLPITPVGTRTFQAAHTYGAAGFFTISMTVRDGDGGVSNVKQAFVVIEGAAASSGHTVGLVDPSQGLWHLFDDAGGLETSFFFGNPGDFPIFGDWDGDGVETPGMYRQSDGFVYLRNSNTQGPADIRFFFGNPGDVPIAGDFNGDGRDSLSIYRPSSQTFFIINELGANEGGLGAAELSYVFGDPGDKPFVGDFNGNGVETVGLHRESTGFVYFRNSHTQGNADAVFFFGDPGDRLIAGDWNDNGVFSPALFRPSNTTMYFRFTNTQGNADRQFIPNPVLPAWVPVSGKV
jgi:hypothetical protein